MAKKRTVSQSRTMWVAKGTKVDGKTVQKGYLAQYGKPEKRVSANVRMVTEQGTRTYKQGRRVNRPAAVGGGFAPGARGGTTGANPPPADRKKPGLSRVSPKRREEGVMPSRRRDYVGSTVGGNTGGPSQRAGSSGATTSGTKTYVPPGALKGSIQMAIARKKAALARAKGNKAREAQMKRELQALQRQLSAVK